MKDPLSRLHINRFIRNKKHFKILIKFNRFILPPVN